MNGIVEGCRDVAELFVDLVQAGRDLIESLRPVVENPRPGICRERGVELGLEDIEVAVVQGRQARVRRHVEREAGESAGGLVEQVAGRLDVAVAGGRVGLRLKRGVGHVGRQARNPAARRTGWC